MNHHLVSTEQIHRILIDLAIASIKANDAPMSSATHFNKAITELLSIIGYNINHFPQDIKEVIQEAELQMNQLNYHP